MSNVLLAFIVQSVAAAGMDIRCPRGNFRHALPGTSCHQYYVCRGPHDVEHHVCPAATHFSPERKVCKVGGRCYDIVCAGRVDGRYADTTENCTRWFECQGGAVLRLESCPVDHQFSDERNGCVRAEEAKCPQPKSTARLVGRTVNPCDAQRDGLVAVGNSPVYVRCHNHREMETLACPPGQAFNGQVCRYSGECLSKTDGYHTVEGTDCKEYILCKNRRLVLRSKCPVGLAFDGQSCVSGRIAACPQKNKCSGLPDGVFPNTKNYCRSYYHCRDGHLISEDSCPEELMWNGQRCIPEDDFTCFETHSSIECYGKRGYISDSASGCKTYHYCNHGTKMTYVCTHGKVFNGYQCVPSSEYSCSEQTNNVCKDRASGYYTDSESNCRAYYYCAKSTKITYVCPRKEIFNGVVCVPREDFKCPNINIDCSNRPNGYQRAEWSLQDYIYCSDGVKLATLHCDPDEVYDGEKCVSVKHFGSACDNIRYGHLTDDTCRLYYVCRDETVVKSGVCAEDSVFDGDSCIPKTSVDCNQGGLKTCKGAPNGFYQDFNSNCQKYFYCINGEKTSLSCPEGQVHNGDLCVPSHKFVCPTTKITEYLSV